MTQKRKIINDPVFGFISVSGRLLELVGNRFVQRLTRIHQLGVESFVYPGAVHTRFLHSIGALHLMQEAIDQLRAEGHNITAEEEEAASMAILMHDTGHAPFSHVLEHSLVTGITHEEISALMMERALEELSDASAELKKRTLDIFEDRYEKHFLHQLISSQLDVDRLDYLCRDSFFCGVTEGMVPSARILQTLTLANGHLAVDQKGLYSVEKFLVARRFMYWQVYLHKTSVAAEQMLQRVLRRARELQALDGISPALAYFLRQKVTGQDFRQKPEVLEQYALLDDNDIWAAIKTWSRQGDRILEMLCTALMNRHLMKAEVLDVTRAEVQDTQLEMPGLGLQPSSAEYIQQFEEQQQNYWMQQGFSREETHYFYDVHRATSNMYKPEDDQINIRMKDGRVVDVSEASDLFVYKPKEKYYLYKYGI